MSESETSVIREASCPVMIDSSDFEEKPQTSVNQKLKFSESVMSSRSESLESIGKSRVDRKSGRLKSSIKTWSLKAQDSPKNLAPMVTEPIKKVLSGAGNFIVNHMGSVSIFMNFKIHLFL